MDSKKDRKNYGNCLKKSKDKGCKKLKRKKVKSHQATWMKL